ncbi:type II secretion system F family protein [Pseudomonadota bacterium AL_CKDN230030165-1A_HGKHYDSX7]
MNALLLGAISLLLLAGALIVLLRASAGARRSATSAYLDARLDQGKGAAAAAAGAVLMQPIRRGGNAWSRMLLVAGEPSSSRIYFVLFAPPALLALIAFVAGGTAAALACFALVLLLGYFRLWHKADKRKRRMVAQLPEFLEAAVRLIVIGNSVSSAFQSATRSVEQPLLEVVQRADALARSGKELDVALAQVARQYGLQELLLVSAVISLALRFGGRSDQVLERMAGFMRDLEAARDELTALSAEIRLSAWVLALLPVGVSLFIIMFNNDLFMNMWNDPMGFRMLVLAAGLQIGGSFWLYRMARGV